MRRVLWLGGSVIALALFSSLQAQQQLPRVQASDMVYEGAFRVPTSGSGTSDFNGFGGGALAYNAANNSLFSVGHQVQADIAEITIPAPGTGTSLASLPTSTYRQSFADVLEGRRTQIGGCSGVDCPIGGILPWGTSLVVTAYNSYNALNAQTSSHFAVNPNFSVTGDVRGPYRLGSEPGRVGGYMGVIPAEWQGLLGGPALTGLCCISIQGLTNVGPGVSVFNPAQVGSTNPIPATEVLGYDLDHRPPETVFKSGDTNSMGGIVVPAGTRTLLFFGKHGEGQLCYGTGQECNDPVVSDKGYHAYPYVSRVWAYDLNDLLAVKNGQRQRHEPLPYAMWNLNPRFGSSRGQIKGATYDPATKRIFVAVTSDAEGSSRPVIHVYQVNGSGTTSPSAPSAPSNLRISS